MVKLNSLTGWKAVYHAALRTVRKNSNGIEPNFQWKLRILLAEHSPIRLLTFMVDVDDLKYWISNHLTRHKVGVEHFVTTQRTDKTGVDRDKLLQSAEVDLTEALNVQALINMSRKRLCVGNASIETRLAWESILDAIAEEYPEILHVCVPDCIYRGYCYEIKSCGYHKTEDFRRNLIDYRRGING